jgi:predicted O-methyltransferase YrrM
LNEKTEAAAAPGHLSVPGNSRRLFNYDPRLLPNLHMAELEPKVDEAWLRGLAELERLDAVEPASEDERERVREAGRTIRRELFGVTSLSMGYPSWNLLYYSVLCSLRPELDELVVIETGTNRGLSTISMAQALKDLDVEAVVDTVDVDESFVEIARENVEAAGLSDYVRFHIGDGAEFLAGLSERSDHVDFVFLDDLHAYGHVVKEISIVVPKLVARRGKIYFDNTSSGGVASALRFLRREYGGNLIEFNNCSGFPPGNAIWQPD